ncbi:MAG: hypothetical protein AB9856_11405 [Cellulosilyticaceae bacterium]
MYKRNLYLLYVIFLSAIFIVPSVAHASQGKLTAVDVPHLISPSPSKSSIVQLPCLDSECYVMVESLTADKINGDLFLVKGTLKINKDISAKNVYVKDTNYKAEWETSAILCFKDEPRKPLQPGEHRSFTAMLHLSKNPNIVFYTKDAISYEYGPDLEVSTGANDLLDFSFDTIQFQQSIVATTPTDLECVFWVNMNYPLVAQLRTCSRSSEDIILTKPLALKLEVSEYDPKTRSEKLIYTKKLKPLNGFISKNMFIRYSVYWDFRDQNGKLVAPNKEYLINLVVPDSFEYRLFNDPTIQTHGIYTIPIMTGHPYYLSDK